MREEMKGLTEDIKAKEEHYRELLDQYSKANRDVTRSHYTDRIMDIVKNVQRQKAEIEKVLTFLQFFR